GAPRCRGMGLREHVEEMETLAEPILDDGGIPAVAVGAGEAARSLDDVRCPAEALLRQQGGGDPALRGMRGLNSLAGGAGIVELRDAAGIPAGEPDRLENASLRVLAAEQKPAGGDGGAEHVAGAGALEAAREMPGLHGECDPDDRLVAGHQRGTAL